MENSMTISKMMLTDVDRIHEISTESFSTPWSLNAIQEEVYNEMAYYLVSRDENGSATGFAGAWLVFDEVQITNIAVGKKYRQKGVAKALLKRLIEDMKERNMSMMFLEVRVSNTPARRLYESQGFVYTGKRNSFYDDKEDALLMTLYLKDSIAEKGMDPRKL